MKKTIFITILIIIFNSIIIYAQEKREIPVRGEGLGIIDKKLPADEAKLEAEKEAIARAIDVCMSSSEITSAVNQVVVWTQRETNQEYSESFLSNKTYESEYNKILIMEKYAYLKEITKRTISEPYKIDGKTKIRANIEAVLTITEPPRIAVEYKIKKTTLKATTPTNCKNCEECPVSCTKIYDINVSEDAYLYVGFFDPNKENGEGKRLSSNEKDFVLLKDSLYTFPQRNGIIGEFSAASQKTIEDGYTEITWLVFVAIKKDSLKRELTKTFTYESFFEWYNSYSTSERSKLYVIPIMIKK